MNKEIRHYLHYIISFYIVFGGIITNNVYWIKMHFYIMIGVLIHWLTNDGQCFLSQMDYKKEDEQNGDGYIAHILSSLNISLTKENIILVGYLSVIIPCIYSLYRVDKYIYQDLRKIFI